MKQFLILTILMLTACTTSEGKVDEVIRTLDGEQETIESLREGRPAIVNFWASWCSFCKDELPLFEEASKKYPLIAMIGVNMQEKESTAKSYWQAGGYTFPTLLDPNKELYQEFGIFTQPTTFILDANGKEIYRKDGPLVQEELDEQIGILKGLYGNLSAVKVTEEMIDDLMSSNQTSPVPSNLRTWYEGEVQHSIPLDQILGGGPPKDGIPSLDNPSFISVNDVEYLSDDDVGLLLDIGGDVRFYPFTVLNWHEIANDTVGGKPVAATYCPLCDTAVVFSRETSRGVTTLGVSGKLYQSNLLMYDRETESLWNQLKGEAVVGPLTGEMLARVPSDIIQWKTVKDSWPQAQVLSADTGYSRDYGRDPYAGYADSEAVYFPVAHEDDFLHPKTRILGIVINGEAKAYVVDGIIEMRNIDDTVGGQSVSIAYDEETEQIIFSVNGKQISPMPSFWFSWVAQYPKTTLY